MLPRKSAGVATSSKVLEFGRRDTKSSKISTDPVTPGPGNGGNVPMRREIAKLIECVGVPLEIVSEKLGIEPAYALSLYTDEVCDRQTDAFESGYERGWEDGRKAAIQGLRRAA